MRGQTLNAAAAALLATVPAVFAGKAKVYNHCDFDVYSWSVDEEQNPETATIIEAETGCYEEEFRTPANGGVSIKLAPVDDVYTPITQLEYTLNYDLWYDVSNVDCTGTECPFQKHGLYLEAGSGCPTVSCPAGNLTCHGAYTLWDDNWASLCCTAQDSDVVLRLCKEGPDNGDTSVSVETVSEPESEPEPVSHYVAPTPSSSSAYEPETVYEEITQVATVYTTIAPEATPDSYDSGEGYGSRRRRRHMHNHMEAHNHRH